MSLFTLTSTAIPSTKRKFGQEEFFVAGFLSYQNILDSSTEAIDQLSSYKLDFLVIYGVDFVHPFVKEIIDHLHLKGYSSTDKNVHEGMIISSNNQVLSVVGNRYFYDHSGWRNVHLNISKKNVSRDQRNYEILTKDKKAFIINLVAGDDNWNLTTDYLAGNPPQNINITLKATKKTEIKMMMIKREPLPPLSQIPNPKKSKDKRRLELITGPLLHLVILALVIITGVVVGTILYKRARSQRGINA